MRQLILYIIFLMSMVFSGYGKVSAASIFFHLQDSHSITQSRTNTKKDRLMKIDHKQDKPTAQLEDASTVAYRVCNSRPQRLLPSGNIHSNTGDSSLLFNRIRVLSSLLSAIFGGYETLRLESAPIHFDVASKYYVICLRHLRC